MQDVASISAMHQFHFGRRIRCSDGEAGRLTQVVFDSASCRMRSGCQMNKRKKHPNSAQLLLRGSTNWALGP
jgi:hypothetical protein